MGGSEGGGSGAEGGAHSRVPAHRTSALSRAVHDLRLGLFASYYVLQKKIVAHRWLAMTGMLVRFCQMLGFPLKAGTWVFRTVLPLTIIADVPSINAWVTDGVINNTGYFILFFLSLAWVALYLALQLWALVGFTNGTIPPISVLRLLRSVANVSATVAFIPVFTLLLSVFACDHHDAGGHHDELSPWMAAGYTCFEGGHLALSIIACVGAAALLFMCSLFALFFFDAHPLSANLGARAHGRTDFAVLLIKCVLVVIFETLYPFIPPWGLVFIAIGSGVVWLAVILATMPSLTHSVNAWYCAAACMYTALGVAALCSVAYPSFDAAVLAYVSMPLAGIAGVWLAGVRRHRLKRMPVWRMWSPYDAELKARYLMQDMVDDMLASPHAHVKGRGDASTATAGDDARDDDAGGSDGAAAAGTASARGRAARVQDAHASTSDTAADQLWRITYNVMEADARADFLRERVDVAAVARAEEVLRAAVVRFPHSAILHVFIARFCAVYQADMAKQMGHLMQAHRLGAPVDVSFLVYAARRVADSRAPAGVSSALNRVSFEKHMSHARMALQHMAEAQVALWNQLLEAVPSLPEMHALTSALARADGASATAFTELFAVDPQSIIGLRLYAQYQLLAGNSERAAGILEEAERLEDQRARETQNASAQSVATPFGIRFVGEAHADIDDAENVGVLTMGAASRDLGVILSANASACRTLSSTRLQLERRTLGVLIPAPLAEMVETDIRRYVSTGESDLVGVTCAILARNRSGHAFPVTFCLREAAVEDESPTLTLLLRALPCPDRYLLLDADLRVTCACGPSVEVMRISEEDMNKRAIGLADVIAAGGDDGSSSNVASNTDADAFIRGLRARSEAHTSTTAAAGRGTSASGPNAIIGVFTCAMRPLAPAAALLPPSVASVSGASNATTATATPAAPAPIQARAQLQCIRYRGDVVAFVLVWRPRHGGAPDARGRRASGRSSISHIVSASQMVHNAVQGKNQDLTVAAAGSSRTSRAVSFRTRTRTAEGTPIMPSARGHTVVDVTDTPQHAKAASGSSASTGSAGAPNSQLHIVTGAAAPDALIARENDVSIPLPGTATELDPPPLAPSSTITSNGKHPVIAGPTGAEGDQQDAQDDDAAGFDTGRGVDSHVDGYVTHRASDFNSSGPVRGDDSPKASDSMIMPSGAGAIVGVHNNSTPDMRGSVTSSTKSSGRTMMNKLRKALTSKGQHGGFALVNLLHARIAYRAVFFISACLAIAVSASLITYMQQYSSSFTLTTTATFAVVRMFQGMQLVNRRMFAQRGWAPAPASPAADAAQMAAIQGAATDLATAADVLYTAGAAGAKAMAAHLRVKTSVFAYETAPAVPVTSVSNADIADMLAGTELYPYSAFGTGLVLIAQPEQQEFLSGMYTMSQHFSTAAAVPFANLTDTVPSVPFINVNGVSGSPLHETLHQCVQEVAYDDSKAAFKSAGQLALALFVTTAVLIALLTCTLMMPAIARVNEARDSIMLAFADIPRPALHALRVYAEKRLKAIRVINRGEEDSEEDEDEGDGVALDVGDGGSEQGQRDDDVDMDDTPVDWAVLMTGVSAAASRRWSTLRPSGAAAAMGAAASRASMASAVVRYAASGSGAARVVPHPLPGSSQRLLPSVSCPHSVWRTCTRIGTAVRVQAQHAPLSLPNVCLLAFFAAIYGLTATTLSSVDNLLAISTFAGSRVTEISENMMDVEVVMGRLGYDAEKVFLVEDGARNTIATLQAHLAYMLYNSGSSGSIEIDGVVPSSNPFDIRGSENAGFSELPASDNAAIRNAQLRNACDMLTGLATNPSPGLANMIMTAGAGGGLGFNAALLGANCSVGGGATRSPAAALLARGVHATGEAYIAALRRLMTRRLAATVDRSSLSGIGWMNATLVPGLSTTALGPLPANGSVPYSIPAELASADMTLVRTLAANALTPLYAGMMDMYVNAGRALIRTYTLVIALLVTLFYCVFALYSLLVFQPSLVALDRDVTAKRSLLLLLPPEVVQRAPGLRAVAAGILADVGVRVAGVTGAVAVAEASTGVGGGLAPGYSRASMAAASV